MHGWLSCSFVMHIKHEHFLYLEMSRNIRYTSYHKSTIFLSVWLGWAGQSITGQSVIAFIRPHGESGCKSPIARAVTFMRSWPAQTQHQQWLPCRVWVVCRLCVFLKKQRVFQVYFIFWKELEMFILCGSRWKKIDGSIKSGMSGTGARA